MNKVSTSTQNRLRALDFKSTNHGRWVTAVLIVLTSFNLSLPSLSSSPVVFASPRSGGAVATGTIRVAGDVTIDGMRATSAQTIFPGSLIATAEESGSIIELGRLTRLRLSAATEFTLDFSRISIFSAITKGVVRGYIPAGMPVTIKTAVGELVTDSSQSTIFMVQVDGDTIKVSVEKGRVEVISEDKRQTIGAGQYFATGFGTQSQAAQPSSLTNRQKVGLFAAIGAAAAILAIAIMGRDEEELDFGDCVIIPSGEQSSICP